MVILSLLFPIFDHSVEAIIHSPAVTKQGELDAQRQYMVIGSLALLLIFLFVIFYVSRAAAPEGTGGDSVLYGDLLDLINALPDTFEDGNKSQILARDSWGRGLI